MEEIAGRIKQGYKWERNDVSPSLEFFSIQRLSDHPESAQLSVAVFFELSSSWHRANSTPWLLFLVLETWKDVVLGGSRPHPRGGAW